MTRIWDAKTGSYFCAGPKVRHGVAALALGAGVAVVPALASGQAAQDTVQSGTILGRVFEATTGDAIGGARATLVGTSRVALTSRDGEFRMGRIDAGTYALQLRANGYESVAQDVVVRAGGVVRPRFELQLAVVPLQEVVVTGQAQESSLATVGSSVAVIHTEEIEAASVSTLSELLQSRVPGLTVLTGGGKVGQGSRVVLRGPTTITRHIQPVIYVDGVRIYNTAENGLLGRLERWRWMGGDTWAGLDDINPDDVERVEVLRGPAAAALYGTDGAAGVIQIFTKRGGGGAQEFTLRSEYGQSTTPQAWWDVSEHGGWYHDNIVETGKSQSFRASMQGGADRFSYYTAATLRSETGVVADNWMDYWSFRSNMRAMPTQQLALTLQAGFSFREIGLPYDGSSEHGLGRNGLIGGELGDLATPEEILSYEVELQATRLTTGAALEYIPHPNFTHRLSFGADIFNSDNGDWNPWGTTIDIGGSVGQVDGRKLSYRQHATYLSLDYHGNFTHTLTRDVRSTTSFGAQGFVGREAYTMAHGWNFIGPGLSTVSTAQSTDGDEHRIPTEALGLFVHERLGIRDRLFLGASLRVDGHSAFGPDNRFQTYPSVSASYVASELRFVPEFVSTLRLRGAYGTAGLQPGEFLTQRTWQPIETGGDAGFIPGDVGNPELKPEVSRELEAGVDLGLLDNRVTVEATYYHRRTEDIVFPSYQPPSTGYPEPQWLNIGTVDNEGFEGAALVRLLERPGLRWDVRVGLATNENTVVDLGVSDSLNVLPDGSRAREQIESTQWIREGYPIAGFFMDSGEYIGPAFPTRTLNASTTLEVGRRLRLSALLDHRGGHYLQSNTLISIEVDRRSKLEEADPGFNAPIEEYGDYVFPADSWRLREVSLSYELPASLARAIRLDGASLSVAGRNLWREQEYEGLEAESSYATTEPLINQTWFNTPLPRQVVGRLEIRF